MNFTQESRGDKLWTPGDSVAQKHKLWVDDNFPTEVRVSSVLLVAGDVLTPDIFKEVSESHNYMSYVLLARVMQFFENVALISHSESCRSCVATLALGLITSHCLGNEPMLCP